MSKPKLLVVVASVRPGRVGRTIADWFIEAAKAHDGFEITEADLADLALPLMDEPNHPRFQRYEHEHTKQWSKLVSDADAFVFVMPEYNHSFPPSLKNAVDYLHKEWLYKSLGFVSYGGIAGGTRSVEAFLQIAVTLQMMVPQNLVHIPFFSEKIDDVGRFIGDDGVGAAAHAMLDEMLKLERGLSVIREA